MEVVDGEKKLMFERVAKRKIKQILKKKEEKWRSEKEMEDYWMLDTLSMEGCGLFLG